MIKLRATDDLAKTTLLGQVEDNLLDYFRWCFLEANGFANIPVTTPGTDDPYDDEKLFPVHMDGVADGKIWQAVHTDWCWESGLQYASAQPTVCTGLYINGTLYPTASTTGTYAHRLNFTRGLATFTAAIPMTSVVQAAFAYHRVSLFNKDVAWFRDVVLDGYLLEQSKGTDVVALLDSYRVQAPFIVLESVLRRTAYGKELGSRVQWQEQDVLFHVIAESKDERDRICDAITLQKDEGLMLYDVNAAIAADESPLDWAGSPRSGRKNYPALVAAYPWRRAYFAATAAQDVDEKLPLFRGVCRATVCLDF